METTESPIPYSTINQLADNWTTSKAKIENAISMLCDVQNTMKAVFGAEYFSIEMPRYSIGEKDAEQIIKKARKDAWRYIINKSEMKRFLSIKRTKELEKKLEEEELPEISTDEILALIKSGIANIQNFADEAVFEVFELLHRHSEDYKNNQKFAWEVGKRVVLTWWVEQGYGSSKFYPNYSREAEFRALDNVFHALDGKGFSASYWGELGDAIKASDGAGETTYFKFKCYKNHNLHLEFKRMDLVKKMNAIASKNILKPQNEAA